MVNDGEFEDWAGLLEMRRLRRAVYHYTAFFHVIFPRDCSQMLGVAHHPETNARAGGLHKMRARHCAQDFETADDMFSGRLLPDLECRRGSGAAAFKKFQPQVSFLACDRRVPSTQVFA
jgi:hypothetical protein